MKWRADAQESISLAQMNVVLPQGKIKELKICSVIPKSYPIRVNLDFWHRITSTDPSGRV